MIHKKSTNIIQQISTLTRCLPWKHHPYVALSNYYTSRSPSTAKTTPPSIPPRRSQTSTLYHIMLTHPNCKMDSYLDSYKDIWNKRASVQTTKNFQNIITPPYRNSTFHKKPTTTLPRCHHYYKPGRKWCKEKSIHI